MTPQEVFDNDYARTCAALERANAIGTHPDGSQYIIPGHAPEALVNYYAKLVALGYAEGFIE